MAVTAKLPALSFTTGGTDMTVATAWTRIDGYMDFGNEGPTGHAQLGPQLLDIKMTSATSSGSGVFAIRWYDAKNTEVVGQVTFAVTVTAVRTALGGGSGDYMCTVVSDLDGTRFADLSGIGNNETNTRSTHVYAGFISMSTMAQATMYSETLRAV